MLSKLKSNRILTSFYKNKHQSLIKLPKHNFSNIPDVPIPITNKLFEFSPETIGRVPFFLEFLTPYLEISSKMILQFMNFTHLPLPIILLLISFCIRSSFLPIIIMQTKKLSKFTDKSYFIKELKIVYQNSKLKKRSKIYQLYKILKLATKRFKLEPLKLVLMNVLHLPFIFFSILTLRKTIVSENLKNTSFLHVPNLLEMDPYFIFPLLTCSIFYYNFGKGVTPLTKNTFFGRFRYFLQIGMILWFPLLSHWPAAIVFYIMCNAIFSTLQMKLTSSEFFLNKMSPNFMVSMMISNKIRNSEKRFLGILGQYLPYRIEGVVREEEIVYQAEQEIKMIVKDQKKRGLK